tara:strand:+ start:21 stop:461 length:441 start_codon:yes stop_codon:yes gene_type:complete
MIKHVDQRHQRFDAAATARLVRGRARARVRARVSIRVRLRARARATVRARVSRLLQHETARGDDGRGPVESLERGPSIGQGTVRGELTCAGAHCRIVSPHRRTRAVRLGHAGRATEQALQLGIAPAAWQHAAWVVVVDGQCGVVPG